MTAAAGAHSTAEYSGLVTNLERLEAEGAIAVITVARNKLSRQRPAENQGRQVAMKVHTRAGSSWHRPGCHFAKVPLRNTRRV